jgi:hypothetical protein
LRHMRKNDKVKINLVPREILNEGKILNWIQAISN